MLLTSTPEAKAKENKMFYVDYIPQKMWVLPKQEKGRLQYMLTSKILRCDKMTCVFGTIV